MAGDGNVIDFPNEPWKRPGFVISDKNLARCFVIKRGTEFCYSAPRKCWRTYDGTRWVDASLKLESATGDLLEDIEPSTKNPRNRLTIGSTKTLLAVERRLRSMLEVDEAIFDTDPWLYNCPSGTIDLHRIDDGPRKHDRDDYITKLSAVDPYGECPHWLDFIDWITRRDAQLADYLQRLAGYALAGVADEQMFAFFHGSGGNGKSVFLQTLLYVLGDYGVTAPSKVFIQQPFEQHPEEMMRLRGARLIVSSEVPADAKWNQERVQAVTGGERIVARGMRENSVEFGLTGTLIIAGNNKPELVTVNDAIKRRMHLVPFKAHVEDEDVDGVGPIRSFDISPETLAIAAGADASAGAQAVSAFKKALLTNRWALYSALEDGSFNRRLAADCPGCFIYLALTIFVDSQRDGDAASDQFRPKLAAFLGGDKTFSKLSGIATMWKALRDWLARQAKAGKPFRKLVLPDEDGWVQIGHTLRLSFPSRRDRTFLGHFFDLHPGIVSDQRAMLADLRNLVDRSNASRGLRDAFDEFYDEYLNDRRTLADHRFWKFVLSVAEARNLELPIDVSLEIYPDQDGFLQFKIDVPGESGRGSVHSTLQAAVEAVTKLGFSNLRKVVEAGYVVLKRVGTARWSAVPRFSDCRGEVKVGLCRRLTVAVGTKLGRLRSSGDWSLTNEPVSIARAEDALRRLLVKGDLRQIISGVTVAGGVRTDRHWLGRRSVLPTIESDLGLPTIVPEGEDDAPALVCKEVEPNLYAIRTRRPISGAFELRSSATTAVELHFVADAFVHDLQAPANAVDLPEWTDVVELRSRVAEPPNGWDAVPEAMDDLLEAIYAGGRRGWNEADLVPLLERLLPEDIGPWDFLRSLHEATTLTPFLRARFRGRTWALGRAVLVRLRSRTQEFVVIDGCLPARLRRDFEQIVKALGGRVFRRMTSRWSVPLIGAAGVSAESLQERLEWPIRPAMMPGRRPAAFEDAPQRRLEAYRREYAWSWDAGRFTFDGSPARVRLARWVHLGERDHDVYVVSGRGPERMFVSRCGAIVQAHMSAGRAMYRLDAGRLVRVGQDGFLPDRIAHWLRYENLVNSGPLSSGGYAYEVSQGQATAIASLLSGVVDAGQTLRASWDVVASARRSGFAERLIFTDGCFACGRAPFDPAQWGARV